MSPELTAVCEAMEELVEKLEVLAKPVGARERRAELTARRLAQVALRVLRPLTRAIRAGATADGVEAALAETVEVALTFCWVSRGGVGAAALALTARQQDLESEG